MKWDSEVFEQEAGEAQELDEAQKRDKIIFYEDVKKTFSTPHGKRVARVLLNNCHIFNPVMTGNSKTFFLDGERNIGLKLLAWLKEADPKLFGEILVMDALEEYKNFHK